MSYEPNGFRKLHAVTIGKSTFRNKNGGGLYLKVNKSGSISSIDQADYERGMNRDIERNTLDNTSANNSQTDLDRKKSEAAQRAPELVEQISEPEWRGRPKTGTIPLKLTMESKQADQKRGRNLTLNTRTRRKPYKVDVGKQNNEDGETLATMNELKSPGFTDVLTSRSNRGLTNVKRQNSSIQNTPKMRLHESESSSDLEIEMRELNTELTEIDDQTQIQKKRGFWSTRSFRASAKANRHHRSQYETPTELITGEHISPELTERYLELIERLGLERVFHNPEMEIINRFCLEYTALCIKTDDNRFFFFKQERHFKRVFDEMEELTNSVRSPIGDINPGPREPVLITMLFLGKFMMTTDAGEDELAKRMIPLLAHEQRLSFVRFRTIVRTIFDRRDFYYSILSISRHELKQM
jgi:hypothetical protein